ncbi:MAG: PHP domain-containing protein, partial [Flavobacteriaceae bacterium]
MKKILLLLALFVSQAMIAQKTRPPFFKAPKGLQLLSTDLHIHTVFSDGSVWPDIRVQEALR